MCVEKDVLEKRFQIVCRVLADIDDYLEYQYRGHKPNEIKETVMRFIDNGANKLEATK